MSRLNKELITINIEILSSCGDFIKQYDTGLELLNNLDLLFAESDYDGKRILAGLLFTKKLVFGNSGCRTAEVNEVVEVLTRFNKGFRGGEKEKADFSVDFSALVPHIGQISKNDDTVADYWREVLDELSGFYDLKELIEPLEATCPKTEQFAIVRP